MKKKSIKKFQLNKTTIVKFEAMKNIKGGTGGTKTIVISCPDPEKSVRGTVD